jgi:hypothetical protein
MFTYYLMGWSQSWASADGLEVLSPSALHALDLQDNDEIKDNLMVWVVDTNKTLNAIILCNTTVSERSKQWGKFLAAEKVSLPVLMIQLKIF